MKEEDSESPDFGDHSSSEPSSDRENRQVNKNGRRGRSPRRRSLQRKNYYEGSSSSDDDDDSPVEGEEDTKPQARKRRHSAPNSSSSRSKQQLRSASPRKTQKVQTPSRVASLEVAKVGTRVYKQFDAGWFWGEVYGIVDKDAGKVSAYKVVYEDSDKEDMDPSEIKPFIRSASKNAPSEDSLKRLAQAVKRRQEEMLENSSNSAMDNDEESELMDAENSDTNDDTSSGENNAPPPPPKRAERKTNPPKSAPTQTSAKKSGSPAPKKVFSNKNDESDFAEGSSAAASNDDDGSSDESDYGAARRPSAGKKPTARNKTAARFAKKPKIERIQSDSEGESDVSDDGATKQPSTTTASSSRKRKPPHISASTRAGQTTKPGAKKAVAATPKPKKAKVAPKSAKPAATKRKPATAAKSSDGFDVRNNLKAPYTDGDDLPIITVPQLMFDDMLERLTDSGKNAEETILPLLEKLNDRPLRLATMCSGTESPILALDMIQKAISSLCEKTCPLADALKQRGISAILPMEHVFSCEIEPFKQAYIERNFHPPILFRDIRELCNDQAYTAYGSKVDVPQEGSVDILIAGTSCVDYSNLNTQKKSIEEGGESGQTFGGMMAWIRKAKPAIVVIENVSQAPWDIKVDLFEEEGYAATFKRLDTKKYYIPHTRQRGYLFAVRNGDCGMEEAPDAWTKLVSSLERPASASLDAFMLANDDPRVIRGRIRLTAESVSSNGDGRGDKAGRTDWTKCETRHHLARQKEALGDGKPLTNWSDSGSTSMPSFAFNEWVDKQVHRIHDLLDINTLRMSGVGVDCTYKTMVWNVSQNVDRDTMGKLGLCQCITPTGVPYVTNRGGPLVGEELLLLQGIPADDLILTKESEDNLKDLAGNAMSTTVVGAAVLSALIAGCEALESSPNVTSSLSIVPCLVPRPLNPPCDVSIDQKMGKYIEKKLELAPVPFKDQHEWTQFLESAYSSSRKCASEGTDEALPVEELMICQDCGKTASRRSALPPRAFEKHNFVQMERSASRLEPFNFRSLFVSHLPMEVHFEHLETDEINPPAGVEEALWSDWTARMKLLCNGQSATTFRFNRLHRSHCWTAHYASNDQNRLECRISSAGVTWLLFLNAQVESGQLRDVLQRPVARMRMSPASDASSFTLLNGDWELCLPTCSTVKLIIEGSGARVDSWRKRLGLKGDFEREEQYELLNIRIESTSVDDASLKSRIEGSYKILPDCGGACGSLRKKVAGESVVGAEEMYFFLECGRKSMPEDDTFVFAPTFHRTSYGEYRETDLQIDPKLNFRPLLFRDQGKQESQEEVTALVRGRWVRADKARLLSSDQTLVVLCPNPGRSSPLSVPVGSDSWKRCPLLTSCSFPVEPHGDLFRSKSTVELNLQKSQHVLSSVAFATSRLSLPFPLSSRDGDLWYELDRHDMEQSEGDDVVCDTCAPVRPPTHFREVRKGKTKIFLPIEDVEQAGVYERALKKRPQPWIVRFSPSSDQSSLSLTMSIGCNPASLALRAFGRLPQASMARKTLIELPGSSIQTLVKYEWRVVAHTEKSVGEFPKLTFKSNKEDFEAAHPPNFMLDLRHEQLRSLTWMLNQESSCDPFHEEEVEEAVLPSLSWRAEGSAKRPVLVRGGIIADEVGYGKTAITLGLIDSAPPPSWPPKHCRSGWCLSKATLVIVPGHLMGQWPDEVRKFLSDQMSVVVINNMQSLNKLTLGDLMEADLVIANFTVLSADKYVGRLARLSGVNPDIVSHAGGRHFDDVYDDCLKRLPTRVAQILQSCGTAFSSICEDAKKNAVPEDAVVRVDSKKSVYKNGSPKKPASKTKSKIDASDRDPWGLSTKDVKGDYKLMTCPPLELFHWHRIVVDEFTYLEKNTNDRVRKIVHSGLQSNFRWFLSGTPRHATFNDIQALSSLLGVHLGTDELLPGMKFGRLSKDNSGLEHLTKYLDVKSIDWHERRHKLAQRFLDRFVRQNVAEIDEIPFEDRDEAVDLPPAERAIYLELDTHLKSLGMNSKQAIKSKKSSTGDRESRMQSVLKDSETGDEALLKYCCHFNFDSDSTSALKTIDELIKRRESQKDAVAQEVVFAVAAAYRQRQRILKFQPGWASTKKTEKLEVSDALAEYLDSVANDKSVTHGADGEIHAVVKQLVRTAETEFESSTGNKKYFTETLADDESNDEPNGKSSKKRKASSAANSRPSDDELYEMKFALRNHMHKVRSLAKELCGRLRSLRYIKRIKSFQAVGESTLQCPSCGLVGLPVPESGVLSLCGHFGCLKCLKEAASVNKCVDPKCSAHVSCSHIVSAADLGLHRQEVLQEGKYGHKLTRIVEKVKELIEQDRVIVFCQFDELKAKVKEALNDAGIHTVTVSGSVQDRIKSVRVFQKAELEDADPRVLLLKMDDEQSAGLNLTNLNHAVFVHPLLANTQQEYDAYETQAIGRIRRYGQQKTVYVWRFFANQTIDTELLDKFRPKEKEEDKKPDEDTTSDADSSPSL